tara:strand:- start:99 stop:239 length:141 start_codon:yes stop_codon:yes gene_type:complete
MLETIAVAVIPMKILDDFPVKDVNLEQIQCGDNLSLRRVVNLESHQ